MKRVSQATARQGLDAAADIEVPWPYTGRPALEAEYRAGFAEGVVEVIVSKRRTVAETRGGRVFQVEPRECKPPRGATDTPRVPLMASPKDFTKGDAWWDGYKDGRRVRTLPTA